MHDPTVRPPVPPPPPAAESVPTIDRGAVATLAGIALVAVVIVVGLLALVATGDGPDRGSPITDTICRGLDNDRDLYDVWETVDRQTSSGRSPSQFAAELQRAVDDGGCPEHVSDPDVRGWLSAHGYAVPEVTP